MSKPTKPVAAKKSNRPQHRRLVRDVPVVDPGVFAVMRHSRSRPKNMHFSTWQESEEAAIKEAQRLATEVIAEYGMSDTCFYVMKVVRRVGIIGGKLSS